MKLEVMNVAEARKLVDDYMFEVTDWRIEKVMENINNEITERALLGETFYMTFVDFELSNVGFRDFGRTMREAVFRPVFEALRSAGYTVKVDAGYSDNGYSNVTICW